MRILHFADLHLGIETYGSVQPETGLSSRLADVLRVLDELVDFAVSERADLVLFCGDAYKTREPSQTQQRELAKRVKTLSEAGIPLFLLVGNHDLPNSPGRANTLEIFQTLGVNQVFVGSRPSVQVIETKSGPLQVAALPWLRRSALLSQEEGRTLTADETNRRLEELLAKTVAHLGKSVELGIPAVLAGHVSVSSATVGSERSMAIGKEPVLLPGNLALPAFDYVALGHVHRAQQLSESPPVVYSGSLERVDFSEENDVKGFYEVRLDPDAMQGLRCAQLTFHAVSARRFVSFEITLGEEEDDPTAAVLQAVAEKESVIPGAVVRLQVTYPDRLSGLIREAEIRRALAGASYVNIVRNPLRQARIRLAGRRIEELSPQQALELYFDALGADKLPAQRRKALVEHAEKLVAGLDQGG